MQTRFLEASENKISDLKGEKNNLKSGFLFLNFPTGRIKIEIYEQKIQPFHL